MFVIKKCIRVLLKVFTLGTNSNSLSMFFKKTKDRSPCLLKYVLAFKAKFFDNLLERFLVSLF